MALTEFIKLLTTKGNEWTCFDEKCVMIILKGLKSEKQLINKIIKFDSFRLSEEKNMYHGLYWN